MSNEVIIQANASKVGSEEGYDVSLADSWRRSPTFWIEAAGLDKDPAKLIAACLVSDDTAAAILRDSWVESEEEDVSTPWGYVSLEELGQVIQSLDSERARHLLDQGTPEAPALSSTPKAKVRL